MKRKMYVFGKDYIVAVTLEALNQKQISFQFSGPSESLVKEGHVNQNDPVYQRFEEALKKQGLNIDSESIELTPEGDGFSARLNYSPEQGDVTDQEAFTNAMRALNATAFAASVGSTGRASTGRG